MDHDTFKSYLIDSRYNWKPELDVDDLIQQLPEMQVSPIYRSGNMDCCTAVVAVVPAERYTEWNTGDHTSEIEAANQWYSDHELVICPDGQVVPQRRSTMATVITVSGHERNPTIVIPQSEHNTSELEYLLSSSQVFQSQLQTSIAITEAYKMVRSGTADVIWIPYLQIPRHFSVDESFRSICWENFLISSQPYVYGREGRFREPAPLAEV